MEVEQADRGEPHVPARTWLLKSLHCPDVLLLHFSSQPEYIHSPGTQLLASFLTCLGCPVSHAAETGEICVDWVLCSLFFQDHS